MWTIFKVFIEFVTIFLLFFFFFLLLPFDQEADRVPSSRPNMEPAPPTLEGSLNQWTTREAP